MKTYSLLLIPILLLNFKCKNSAPAEEMTDKRSAVVEGKTMECSRGKTSGNLFWNEEAKKLSEAWKKEASQKRDSLRRPMAAVFDEDSSILIGLSEKEIIDLLGKPENEKEKSYKYDFHYTEKNEYMGCWLQLVYGDDKKVKDVVRICP